MRTSAIAAATLAAVLGLAACGSETEDSEAAESAGGTSTAADAAFPATVDTMFGEVTIEEEPQRVVALGWADAETALALGVQPIATRDWQSFGGTGVGPWAADLFDEDPEIIGTDELDIEAIAALQPDLILNVRSDNAEADYELLSELAPTVYAPEGTASFGTDWRTQMTTISTALGQPEEGEELISEVEAGIAEAREANPEFEGSSIVVGAAFGGGYGAYLPGDGRLDFVQELGFENSPEIAEQPSQGFYVDISAERTDLLDADVTVMLPIGGTVEQIETDPLISALPSAQQGRLLVLDPESDVAGAYSSASTLALQYSLEEFVPLLAEAQAGQA